ncbi:MAG: insulinase family protein, partial [Bacteroidetes bacterium]|nr:insulinase family protein [Bacteroidota bacterium]
RFVATILLNTILGEGPESRLRRMFWGRHTISPTFTAAVAFSQDCSYFMISGSATPLMADSVFAFAHETVSEIVKEGVTEEELEAAKSQLLSNELLTFASNRNMQSLLKESVVYRIPFKKMLGFTDRLRAVTTEDVRRVAADLFEPGRWTQVTLGSATKLRPVIEASGRKVVIIEDDRPKDDGERDAGENEQEK